MLFSLGNMLGTSDIAKTKYMIFSVFILVYDMIITILPIYLRIANYFYCDNYLSIHIFEHIIKILNSFLDTQHSRSRIPSPK